jgi:hypothetical protein
MSKVFVEVQVQVITWVQHPSCTWSWRLIHQGKQPENSSKLQRTWSWQLKQTFTSNSLLIDERPLPRFPNIRCFWVKIQTCPIVARLTLCYSAIIEASKSKVVGSKCVFRSHNKYIEPNAKSSAPNSLRSMYAWYFFIWDYASLEYLENSKGFSIHAHPGRQEDYLTWSNNWI